METRYLKWISFGLLTTIVFGLAQCKKEIASTEKVYAPSYYLPELPQGYPPLINSEKNPLTKEGEKLGAYLYSDPILSSNGMTCTSCHQPALSWSGPLYVNPKGIKTSVPIHLNLGFRTVFNWNGSAPDLDLVAKGDFEPEFFNTDSNELKLKLQANSLYQGLFFEAFGVKKVHQLTFDSIKTLASYALAQHLRARIAKPSTFDLYRQRRGTITPEIYRGMLLFFSEKADCFHCHMEPMYCDNSAHNNGLQDNHEGVDKGLELVTGKASDRGKFITPTLRNLSKTGPYMHDGRFTTLEEVIEFYDSGIKNSETLDPIMFKRHEDLKLNLTQQDKADLVSFLKSLNSLEE
ncbi:MAG: c-type cytochrome [Bacteroidia bacterium]|nr:c-type cytochrome [Bacteroidia bacterium]